jgi:WD40 repeat protein/ABC-type oligopeptide transport system ATPase subunit
MSYFPYPGLRPFKQEESDIFFGRDEPITNLTAKLDDHHFIAVIGDSGCGKSSLVRAGLLTRLRMVKVGGREHWRIANMRPGNNPFFNLAFALLKKTEDSERLALRKEYLSHYKVKPEGAVSHLQPVLAGDPENSHKELEEILPKNHNLLIFVDQFEELFHYSKRGEEEKKEVENFVQWLLASCRPENTKIYVVITMRSEFLDDCARYNGLIEAVNQGFFQSPLLRRDQLKEAVEFPARVYDGALEDDLVKQLLDDVEKIAETDQLLLLQYALMQMWLKVNASQTKKLTLKHYADLGGNLATVLTQNAERAYADFSDNDKKTVEILFRRICKRDEKGKYIRHPVKLEQVAILANVPWQAVSDIVDRFRTEENKFFSSRDKLSSGGYLRADDEIDITHESVIRQWNRLKQWADEEAEWAEFYQHWEKAAQHWRDGKGELWRERSLDNLLDWMKKFHALYPEEKQLKAWSSRYGQDFDLAWKFLENSKEAKEKEEQQTKKAEERKLAQQVELRQREEKLRQSRQRTKIAFASLIGFAVLAGWAFLESYNAQLAQQQAERSEQSRTEILFESYRRHAALLTQEENYAEAQQTLDHTYELDPSVTVSPRNARDLLARFVSMMSGEPQREYHGAEAVLYAVTLSPDKQKLVAVGERGTVVAFDVKTGALLQRFVGHDAKTSLKAVAFAPNGEWFATAGDDKKILRWSFTSNKPIEKPWQTDGKVWALAINSTSDLLASGGKDKVVTVWNVSTGKKQSTLLGHKDIIAGLAFSPNGELLASASYDDTVRLWQVSDWQMQHQLKAHTDNVQEVVFSPNSQLLATSSDDETVRLWKVETGESVASLKGHQDKVFGITFTEDGRYLASGSADSTLRLWDVESGIILRVFQGHTASVTGITTDGKHLFSSSTDSTIKQWNTELPYQYTLNLSTAPTATAIAPDGHSVAVGFKNGSLQGYSLSDKKLIWQQEKVHARDIQRIAFSPNSQFLAAASLDNTATVWQVKTDKLTSVSTIQHKAGVNAVAFSPDNRILLTASYDGQMGLFNLDTQEIRFNPLYKTDMNSVLWDTSGDYVLTANDNMTYLWKSKELQSASKPKPIYVYPPTQETTWWAALSPNAQQVAIVGRYFVVNVYPKSPESEHYILQGHKDTVIRAIFSPDSQQLATVSGDNTVRLWDLLQKSELFTIKLPTKGKNVVWDFDFRCTPKGCWIAVPLTQGKLVLYEMGQIYD